MVLRPAAMAGDGALEGKHWGELLNKVACVRATLGSGEELELEMPQKTSLRLYRYQESRSGSACIE